MTTYTDILDAEIDQDSPVTDTLWTKNRDNPIAIAEGSDDAPVVAAGWHPYDQVEMGDGADGMIYDGTSSVANVETGTFADGYEYRMYLDGIIAGASTSIIVALYLGTSASWSSNITFSGSSVTSGDRVSGDIISIVPHLSKQRHVVNINVAFGAALSSTMTGDSDTGGVYNGTAQKVTNMRVGFSGTNITGGNIYLYRRRMDA